jgi:hypothetical protein
MSVFLSSSQGFTGEAMKMNPHVFSCDDEELDPSLSLGKQNRSM